MVPLGHSCTDVLRSSVSAFQPTYPGFPDESVNSEGIDARLVELDSLLQSTKYSKQKSSLKSEMIDFLHRLTPPKSLNDSTPHDIRMFLVYKDSKGKTQIHSTNCTFRGKHGRFQCNCPVRLSAGSVDSLIGQIRAIYRDFGRGTDWNDMLGIGNPAAAPIVKRYLEAVRLEQSMSSVVPKRATPLFIDKLSVISRYITYKLSNPNISMFEQYILLRDIVFFNLLAHTGDRAGDLGSLMSDQIRWIPGNQGVVFTLTKGKTVDIRDPRVVVLYYATESEFCPLKELDKYLHFCREQKITLAPGFVFRTLNPSKSALSENPYTSSAANVRLKLYLKDVGLFEGESPHSARSGCALTLAWLGISDDLIKSHVGWKSDTMLKHYTVGNEIQKRHHSARAMSTCSTSVASHIAIDIGRFEKLYLFRKSY